jgi:hypothetical protein
MQLTETQIYDSSGSFIVKKKPSHITKFIIKKSIMVETKTRLLERGMYFQKGLVFWVGTLTDGVARVEKVICPEVKSTPVSSKISEKSIENICEAIKKPNAFLLAQVQGHSGRVFDSNLDHDEIIGFEEGFISIGVPNYGANLDKLDNCEVFEYNGSQWTRLGKADVANRFETA